MSTTPTPEMFAQRLDSIEAEHAAIMADIARMCAGQEPLHITAARGDIVRRIDEATAERQLTAAATIDLTMPAAVYRQRPPLSRSDKAWLAVLVALAMVMLIVGGLLVFADPFLRAIGR